MNVYCPSCQFEVDRSVLDACPSCGWDFTQATAATSVVQAAARPKIQCEVDVAFAIDRTGSSEKFRTGIPLTSEIVLNQVGAKAKTVRCWVQSHGDLDLNEQFVLHSDAATPNQAIDDIRKVVYGGGGDPPEHHLDAIENLLNTIPWSADPSRARGAILALLTADTKPTRSGISAAALGTAIKQRGILLYLVCEPTPMLVDLVAAANGLMFEITNSPNANELQRIAAQLAASIVATVRSGGTVPIMVPALNTT